MKIFLYMLHTLIYVILTFVLNQFESNLIIILYTTDMLPQQPVNFLGPELFFFNFSTPCI